MGRSYAPVGSLHRQGHNHRRRPGCPGSCGKWCRRKLFIALVQRLLDWSPHEVLDDCDQAGCPSGPRPDRCRLRRRLQSHVWRRTPSTDRARGTYRRSDDRRWRCLVPIRPCSVLPRRKVSHARPCSPAFTTGTRCRDDGPGRGPSAACYRRLAAKIHGRSCRAAVT